MMRYETNINTSVPGLDVAFLKIGGSLYARVLHKSSGKIVLDFMSRPLPFGMREFVKRLDASEINSIDWTMTANDLEEKYAAHSLAPLASRVMDAVAA